MNEALLRSAAQQIDDLDGQAKQLSDQKKDIYDNIRGTIPTAEFKAWKDAVKLRQKRAVNRAEFETHSELVDAMLSMLEAHSHQSGVKHAVTPEKMAAIAIVSDQGLTRAGGREETNLETGEIFRQAS